MRKILSEYGYVIIAIICASALISVAVYVNRDSVARVEKDTMTQFEDGAKDQVSKDSEVATNLKTNASNTGKTKVDAHGNIIFEGWEDSEKKP